MFKWCYLVGREEPMLFWRGTSRASWKREKQLDPDANHMQEVEEFILKLNANESDEAQ